MPITAAADWPACSVSRSTCTRSPSAADSATRSEVTTATASRPGTWRSEVSTSENIACASAWREPAPSRPARRCFAALKLLTGRIAIVLIEDGPQTQPSLARRPAGPLVRRRASPQSRGSSSPAQAARSALCMSVSVTRQWRPAHLLVGHDAVEHVAVGLGDPRRVRLDPRVAAEVVGRPLERAPTRRTGSRRQPARARLGARPPCPGSARIGPIEITGFEGPITIASASAIASRTAADGRAVSSRAARPRPPAPRRARRS